jgi:hypothetical protein
MVAVFVLLFALAVGSAVAQQPAAQQPAAPAASATAGGFSDVYHVHLVKATPGKTLELQRSLTEPSVDTPMPTHVLLLQHREGDDWDFASVAHEGTSFTVKASDVRMTPARPLREHHTDTITTGPSWPEFARAMGIAGPQAGAQPASGAVYILTTYRGAPGQREQLYQTLVKIDKASRKPGNTVILRHAEGGDWDYAVITHYDSWQDLAADQTDTAADQREKRAGFTQSPGLELREYMMAHHDTIAERIAMQAPAK